MKTVRIVVAVLQNLVIPAVIFVLSFAFVPNIQTAEQVSFFSLMAQILATLLIAFAVLPRFKEAPPIHWTTLLWVGIGESFAILGAVPVWSQYLWQWAFATVLSSAAVAVFAIVASIGPANANSHEAARIKQLAVDAERLDP